MQDDDLRKMLGILQVQTQNIVTTETFHKMEQKLSTLLAALQERCPQHKTEIDDTRKDVDQAFDRIRKLEMKLAGLLVLSSLITPVITAILIKFFTKG